MALSCQQFWDNLKAVANNDDEPGDEIFDAIDAHLAVCAVCRQELATLSAQA